jgi:hypothetical protein
MDLKKRSFIRQAFGWAAAAPLVLAGIRLFGQSAAQQSPQSPMPPHMNPDQPFPDVEGPKIDEKRILQKNNDQIHEDVEKLYELASDLKKEVEKTDSVNVLSLPMMQKAEQVEKLAKHIRTLARGD